MCDSYSDTHTMIGDLGNSGGPLDPLFWPIHPTVDRLWHWRRLNGFDDESWPSDAKHSYFHDVHAKDGTVVTDSSCYGSFDVCILLTSVSESSLCPLAPVSGHAPDDVMSWKNLFDQKDHYYTNSELYDELAPGSDNLPYVYDNFEWEHCISEGYTSDLLYLDKSARAAAERRKRGVSRQPSDHLKITVVETTSASDVSKVCVCMYACACISTHTRVHKYAHM